MFSSYDMPNGVVVPKDERAAGDTRDLCCVLSDERNLAA